MSTQTDPTGGPSGAAGGQPNEAELRAAYEAELSRVTSADLVLQAAASLLNIGAFRLGLTGGGAGADAPGQQDLEQVRDAIDAVRGLLPVIERRAPADLRPLRDALSQLQMAYTQVVSAAGAGAAAAGAGAGPPGQQASVDATQPPPAGASSSPAGAQPAAPGAAQPEQQPDPDGPGPAVASGRLWVPGR